MAVKRFNRGALLRGLGLGMFLISALSGCDTMRNWGVHGDCSDPLRSLSFDCVPVAVVSVPPPQKPVVRAERVSKKSAETVRWIESGVASYYHDMFNDRQTANGEIYQPELYTAAHQTLPFGTLLMVKRPSNGRYVIVRVNDRGPFVDNRSIDLSYAAARQLGYLKAGLSKVDIYVIPPSSALAAQF